MDSGLWTVDCSVREAKASRSGRRTYLRLSLQTPNMSTVHKEAQMKYNELMEAFAAKCGLPDIDLKEGGVVLEFNGIAVAFLENEAIESILLRAVIGTPLQETDGNIAKQMVRANYALCNACGATLCQDPNTKEYVTVLTIPLEIADANLLAKAVFNIVATVNKWKDMRTRAYIAYLDFVA